MCFVFSRATVNREVLACLPSCYKRDFDDIKTYRPIAITRALNVIGRQPMTTTDGLYST